MFSRIIFKYESCGQFIAGRDVFGNCFYVVPTVGDYVTLKLKKFKVIKVEFNYDDLLILVYVEIVH